MKYRKKLGMKKYTVLSYLNKNMKNFLFPFFALLIGIFLPLRSTAQVLNLGSGSTYAVVVGISDYQDEGIPDLRFADKDAEAFANFLRSPAGGELDEEHLKLMTNEEVTLGKFDAALWWLVDECKEGDKVIIYFSGHGDVERRSRSQLGFLLCWDAPPLAYTGGGTFPIYFLKEIISTLSLQNKAKVTLITDACRSGKLAGSSIGGAQATAANLATQYANEIKILSCQPDEYSIEGEQWGGGRGAFSYHLIEGLYGMADGNQDLSVSLMEIGRYLQDKVTTEVEPQSQVPMTVGNFKEKLAAVSPEILEKLKQSKQGLAVEFNTISTRGIEEEILASVDSTIQEQFHAFQQALENKVFLSPANACADFYYKQLIKEPKLEKLHNSMRRNYAAALQDDAQQVLKKWLDLDIEETTLSKAKQTAKYSSYPAYLERAAELLGPEHYIYPFLHARKHFFEGYLMHIDLRNADPELGKKILTKYREALTWQPEFPQVYANMSMVYLYQMQQGDSAAYYADRAVALAPSWIMPYSNLAFIYCMIYQGTGAKNNLEKAEHFLKLADQTDSTGAQLNYWHLNNWGAFYALSGQLDNAALALKKAIKVDSSKAVAQMHLGNVYRSQGNLPGAEAQYKKAVELDSTIHIALSNLADVYVAQNQLAEAEELYKKALKMDSTNLRILQSLGQLYIQTNRFEEGEKILLKIFQADSVSTKSLLALSSGYIQMRRYSEAEKYLIKAIQTDSTSWYAYFNLSQTYAMLNQIDKAFEAANKAIEIGPPIPILKLLLGYIYMIDNQLKKAEQSIQQGLKQDSRNTDLKSVLGWIYIKYNKFKEAEQELLETLAIDSFHADGLTNLAILYGLTGQYEQGEELAMKAIKINPMNPVGLNALGFIYAKDGRFEEADQQLKKALEIFPDDNQNAPNVLLTYAVLHSLQNNIDKAFDYLEQVGQMDHVSAFFYIELKTEPALAPLRAQTERWDLLMEKYFPDQQRK
jgi:tetratricopeptide (TPR) repeat protein